ncbi:MAG: terminase large subunit domain-containing protein [Nitrososphaerales archaeon]
MDDEERERKALQIISKSPSKFCSAVLNFEPFPYQVKMLEDPSKNIIVCAARRVGKSLVMAARALWFAYCHPLTSTLIVAATQRQSILMFDKLANFIDRSSILSGSVVRKTRTLIVLSNGSKITALPCGRSGHTIRGEDANLIIVDEASFVPEDVILSVMTPMLSTTDGTMILLSTPFSRDHFFFRAFNLPGWNKYKFKTEDNPLVKKSYLEQRRLEVGEKRYAQEYLGEFVDDEGVYFGMDLLRPCVHVCADMPKLKREVTCNFCASNSGVSLPGGEDLYGGYDPGGMIDPAAFVVVKKVKGASEDSDTKEFKPAFRVVLTRTYTVGKATKKKMCMQDSTPR